MNTNDFISMFSANLGITKYEAKDLIERIRDIIIRGCKKDGFVKIHNFGRFDLVEKGSKEWKNRFNGKTVVTKEKKELKFRQYKVVSDLLFDSLNKGDGEDEN